LIPNALQPAEIDEVMLCHLLGRAIVLVRDDQLSLAIGRRGQNVRLASKLVGWDIEIMTAEELDEVIDKAVKAFEKIDGVETELAERLVEQGILSYDDLSVMEITDLVNTIEGLSEEQATEIVARAETLAEELSEDLPRRKGGRAAAALLEGSGGDDSAARAGGPMPENQEAPEALATEELTSAVVESSLESQNDAESDHPDVPGDLTDGHRSALPPERSDTEDDEFASGESPESEVDEANDDEIHDLALAVETSGFSPQGHEVTSRPSDDDQGAAIRIVTEAVEMGGPARSISPAAVPAAEPANLARPVQPSPSSTQEVRGSDDHPKPHDGAPS
jgi:N utilization substance protein A